MKNTSGLTRRERRAARRAKKRAWLEEYPKYWGYKENQSASGSAYFPVTISTLVNPKPYNNLDNGKLFGAIMFDKIRTLLGLA